MNIAIISNVRGYSWAGSEELWLATALRALSEKHGVTACLHKDLCKSSCLSSFRAHRGKIVSWRVSSFPRLEPVRELLHPNFADARLNRPDVLLVSLGSLPAALYVPGLCSYLENTAIPYVLLCQFNSEILPISPTERLRICSLIEKSTAQVFVSRHNLSLARRQFNLSLPRARVVLNPCRELMDSPLPFPQAHDPVVMSCVARFEILWKAQDLLIEILSSKIWLDRSWILQFFGVGPDLDYVRQFSASRGLSERVLFFGYVRDVKALWAESHLLVLPSRGEGTPLAVLEAMMCGRPVVTTDVGGNAEVVSEGRDGFISPAATVNCFSETLERAWKSRNSWESMGQVAHQRAKVLCGNNPAVQLLDTLKAIAN